MTAQKRSRPDARTSVPAVHQNEQVEPYGRTAEEASSITEPYQAFEWFKLNSSDWLASTRGLSLAEAGALITLRAMIHERGEPLPLDYARLGRQCGAPSAKAFERIVDTLVDSKLLFRDGAGLWCRDIGEQIVHQRGVSEAAKKNRSKVGKKSEGNQSRSSTGVQRYKSKNEDVDREGAPVEPPSSDQSLHTSPVSTGTDAHERASGRERIAFSIGDIIDVPGHGSYDIKQIGAHNSSGQFHLSVAPPEAWGRLIVPVDESGNAQAGRAWWEDADQEQADQIDWNLRSIAVPTPRRKDRRHAAATA